MPFTTTNPATGASIREYEYMAEGDVIKRLERANDEHETWRRLPVEARAEKFKNLAKVFRKNQESYARLMTEEMGKPITAARAEVEKCAWTCDVYAENAAAWLREEEVAADGVRHRVVLEPLGTILAIMPWNFPFWQVARFLVPTLLVGNGALLKHAVNVTGSARNIEAAVLEAGFPEGLFSVIIAQHESVGKVIDHPLCRGVSLTGSTAVGKRITERAGAHLKKVVMELGGSDPFVVLEDADIAKAAKAAVAGRFQNNGQSCIAAKRFIVHKRVAKEFEEAFVEGVKALVFGDPMDEKTDIGPLVNNRAVEDMEGAVLDAGALGAKILVGGKRGSHAHMKNGCYFEPTVVAGVGPHMKIAKEEIFGPVAPLIVVTDDGEAIRVANDTVFGLGGSVWSKNLEHGERVARQIESGSVFVNHITKSDPRMPFGGIKESGLGRELSHWGMKEFANIKGINVYGA